MREVVAELWPNGHPTKLVHVAGSAGKGSVARMIETGLAKKGRAGAFTKPHVFDHVESFSVGGAPVARETLVSAWENVVLPACVRFARRAREPPLRYTEARLLLALAVFDALDVEWAALEAGLGGRYDESRAIDVVASVVTNVGRDHEEILGREPWQRALDKAGVARTGIPLFLGVSDETTRAAVESIAAHARAPFAAVADRDVARARSLVADAIDDPPLHALENLALATRVVESLGVQVDAPLALAMARAKLPARLAEVEPGVFADVAHNPEKVAALARVLETRFADTPIALVVGVSGSRDPALVLAPVLALASHVVVTNASFKGQDPRGVAEALRRSSRVDVEVVEDPAAALARAKTLAALAKGIVVLTGSAYMIDQALNPDPFLRTLNGTFGWRQRADDR